MLSDNKQRQSTITNAIMNASCHVSLSKQKKEPIKNVLT